MLRILWLCAVLGAAAATNCTICLHEQCYSEHDFKYSYVTLYYAVVDHNYNIMYYYTDDYLNAIELDNNTKIFKKTIKNPVNKQLSLTVDQKTGDVYSYNYYVYYEHPLIFKHDPKTNETTRPNIAFDCYRRPASIYFCNGTVYGINGKYPLFYLKNGSIEDVPGFDNLHIMDFTCDKTGVLYVQTRSEMYRVEANAVKAVLNITTESSTEYRIPTLGADGDVHLLSDDINSRRIYQINSETKEMKVAGAYEPHLTGIRDWKFDKHGNIFTDDLIPDKQPTKYFKPNSIRCGVSTEVKINIGA